VRNITRRLYRTLGLTGVVALLAFVLIGGSLLAFSLLNGTKSTANRLGADALLVPHGYEAKVEGALLRGEPSAFYIDPDVIPRLLAADGIEKASPQLFIASFDSPHCDQLVQFIGFDPETDFVITPWLADELDGGIPAGQIVIGDSILGKPGQTLTFFSQKYVVAAKLERTGMGFDTSVFTDMDTARVALKDYARLGGENVPEGDGVISTLTVDLRSDVSPTEFERSINLGYRDADIGVVMTQAMLGSVSRSLNGFLTIIGVLAVLLWVLTVGVLAVLFGVSVNERKREFGVYRALGATRSRLTRIVLTECVYVSLIGAVVGTSLVCVAYFSFGTLIGLKSSLPYLRPSAGTLTALLAGGFALSLLTGPLAALRSAVKIGKTASYALTREGD
jgi:putative ABC transport system permease protein